jgi:hypothetical protein
MAGSSVSGRGTYRQSLRGDLEGLVDQIHARERGQQK